MRCSYSLTAPGCRTGLRQSEKDGTLGIYVCMQQSDGCGLRGREMVRGLHALGLRVVLDVVYNHTFHSLADGTLLPTFFYSACTSSCPCTTWPTHGQEPSCTAAIVPAGPLQDVKRGRQVWHGT